MENIITRYATVEKVLWWKILRRQNSVDAIPSPIGNGIILFIEKINMKSNHITTIKSGDFRIR